MGLFHQLRHDVEVKKQIVTVAIVGILVTLLEAVLYYYILIPEVRGNLVRMLDKEEPILGDDETTRDAVHIALETAHRREQELTEDRNRVTKVSLGLVLLLLVTTVVLLYAFSAPLRRSNQWHIVADVVVVASGYAAFEYLFYQMGHKWNYEGDIEMQHAVAAAYQAAAPDSAVTACGGCADRLQERLARSTEFERNRIKQYAENAVEAAVNDATQRLERRIEQRFGTSDEVIDRAAGKVVDRVLAREQARMRSAVSFPKN